MSKRIVEELPARKHAPAAAESPAKSGADDKKPVGKTQESSEKRIRQAVYDIRYRARREDIDLKAAFSQYMSNTSMSAAEQTAVRQKLFGKGAVSEQYLLQSVDWASTNLANAMFKVFVEGVDTKEDFELVYESQIQRMKDGKKVTLYSIRVKDPKTGKSYTRDASREDITRLRARGLDVEMSDYVSSETQRDMRRSRKKGDRDGDGKVESSSKEHAGLVHNAIQRATGGVPDGQDTRKEDYLWSEQTTSTEGQNSKKIDVMKSGEQNSVKVFPEIKEELIAEKAKSKAQARFMRMVYATKKGKKKKGKKPMSPEVAAAARSMTKKEARKFAKTKDQGLPEKMEEAVVGGGAPNVPAPVAKFVDELPTNIQRSIERFRSGAAKPVPTKKKPVNTNEETSCPKCDKSPCGCDTRADKTYRDLLKAKFRSMGKNPIVMMSDEENLEKSYNDMMTASFIKTDEKGQLKPVHVFKEEESDRCKDEHQMRGGMAARVDYDRPPAKKKTNTEMGIRDFTDEEREERRKKMSAHLKKMGRA